MSARITSLLQEREATAKEVSAASARYGQMEAENASLRPTASDMTKEGRQIVHDVQREREAVAKAVEATRTEYVAEARRLTEHAEAAGRRCQTALSGLTSSTAANPEVVLDLNLLNKSLSLIIFVTEKFVSREREFISLG